MYTIVVRQITLTGGITRMQLIYFKDCETLMDLKVKYRKLAKIYHPDAGGTNDEMRVINTEYDYLKSRLKSTYEEDWKKKNEFEKMDEYREMIDKVIHLPIDIEIIGDWIWLSSELFEKEEGKEKYAALLGSKGAGYKWSPNRKKYYWAPYKLKGRPKKQKPMDHLRQKYGSTSVKNREPHYLNS